MNPLVEVVVVDALASNFEVGRVVFVDFEEMVVFAGIDVIDLVDNFLVDFLPNFGYCSISDHLVNAHILFDLTRNSLP